MEEATLAETANKIGVDSYGSQIISTIFNTIDSLNVDFVSSVYNALVFDNKELIVSVLAIYVAIYGYLVMLGKISPAPSVSEFVWHIGRVFIILAFGFTFTFFYETIYLFFVKGPDSLISTILNSLNTTYFNSKNINHAASIFYDKGTLLGEAIVSMSDFGMFDVYFVWGAVVWVATVIITVLTVGLVVVPKVLTGILLSLAPIFFTFLLFNSTKGFFEGWIKLLFGCFFVPIILYSLLAMSLFALKPSMLVIQNDALEGVVDSGHVGGFILVAFVLIFLFRKVDSIAMTIAGGYMSKQYQALDGNAKKWADTAWEKYKSRNNDSKEGS